MIIIVAAPFGPTYSESISICDPLKKSKEKNVKFLKNVRIKSRNDDNNVNVEVYSTPNQQDFEKKNELKAVMKFGKFSIKVLQRRKRGTENCKKGGLKFLKSIRIIKKNSGEKYCRGMSFFDVLKILFSNKMNKTVIEKLSIDEKNFKRNTKTSNNENKKFSKHEKNYKKEKLIKVDKSILRT